MRAEGRAAGALPEPSTRPRFRFRFKTTAPSLIVTMLQFCQGSFDFQFQFHFNSPDDRGRTGAFTDVNWRHVAARLRPHRLGPISFASSGILDKHVGWESLDQDSQRGGAEAM
eukprot:m.173810 g.173810  ORF g.173810 m.173810 type:complete len:113 (-) comp14862_c0_seq2:1597-1935(-)